MGITIIFSIVCMKTIKELQHKKNYNTEIQKKLRADRKYLAAVLVPALATLITTILSIVFIKTFKELQHKKNYNTEIQKKLRADRKYLVTLIAEVETEQKSAE